MKRFFLGLLLTISFSCFTAFADQITGYISDAHCGAKHDSPSVANTKCINVCLKGGADPVLVSNGKVYKFDANSRQQAIDHAGQNVTVDGTLNGDVITASSIQQAK